MNEIIQDYIKRFPKDRFLRYHAPRYSTLLDLIKKEYKEGERILDIGRSKLTEIISDSLKTPVDTLGFQPDSDTALGRHYHFDLNNSQNMELWRRDIKPYDLIVFGEVIEHLYTSPNFVLSFINSITSEEGRLFLQTPNAVCLANRIKMLLGRNPFEKIRENHLDPGHFREYTKQEIIEYSENTGFQVDKFIAGNYFDYQYWNAKSDIMPDDESLAQRIKYKLDLLRNSR
jgi:2-polyprenyl-3-methyl-5-hydroxy-6-metoxy-1,4-benzoquinol methylase